MPSKKKKYNARFPPARIKKIMQTDEDVGKVAAAVPVIISRALEKFIETLIVKTSETTQSKNAKTLTTSHIKQTIHGEKKFDFLRDLVASVPDHQTEEDAEGSCITTDSKRLKTPRQRKQRNSGKKRKKKGGSDSSEDGGNVNEEEEEEEEEDDSETETDEEDKTQATPLSDTSSHMASPNQSSGNYPAHSSKASCDNLPSGSHSSQSTNLMGPPIGYNMSGNSQMPHSAFPCATPSGTVPFPLPGMLHPQGMRGPFPMQYDNHMSQQSQPLNLCSTGSSYNLGMFPPSGYPSPYPPINTAPAAFHNHPGPSGQPPNLSHNTEGTKMYMQHKDTSYKDSEKLKIANNNSHTNTVSEPAALNLSMAVKTSINTSTEDDDYDT